MRRLWTRRYKESGVGGSSYFKGEDPARRGRRGPVGLFDCVSSRFVRCPQHLCWMCPQHHTSYTTRHCTLCSCGRMILSTTRWTVRRTGQQDTLVTLQTVQVKLRTVPGRGEKAPLRQYGREPIHRVKRTPQPAGFRDPAIFGRRKPLVDAGRLDHRGARDRRGAGRAIGSLGSARSR